MEFHFGLGPGHLGKQAARIAKRHGAVLVNYTEPRGQKRHWFAARNRGQPFDQALADAICVDLARAGIISDDSAQTA